MLTSAMVWRWMSRLSLEFAVEASSTAMIAAVRIENRRGGAGQREVVAAEVLLAMHGDRARLGEAGADAIGPLVALIPERAQGQSGMPELALQGRVGDGAEHRRPGCRRESPQNRSRQSARTGSPSRRARPGSNSPRRCCSSFRDCGLRMLFCRGADGSMPYSRRHRCQDRVTRGSMPAGCSPLSTT